MIEKEYLNLLACPNCKSNLNQTNNFLICTSCKKKFNVVNGVPILLPKSLSGDLKITQKTWDKEYHLILEDLKVNIENEPYLKDSHKHIKKFLRSGKGYFLEVGCGYAKNSYLLAKEGIKVVGIDISLHAVLHAKKLFNKGGFPGFFVCGDIMNMPFRDSCFSFMYAGGSIEHFKDTQIAVKELFRCLTPGGLVTATVPCISLSTLTYGQLSGNIPDLPIIKPFFECFHIKLMKGKLLMYGYEKSFTIGKIRNIFLKSGFSSIETGLLETYYELKFFKNKFIKNILRKAAKLRPFWPMIYVNGEK